MKNVSDTKLIPYPSTHKQKTPRDAFWGRRVRVLVNGAPTWVSIPLNHPLESDVIGVPINQMTINLKEYFNISFFIFFTITSFIYVFPNTF